MKPDEDHDGGPDARDHERAADVEHRGHAHGRREPPGSGAITAAGPTDEFTEPKLEAYVPMTRPALTVTPKAVVAEGSSAVMEYGSSVIGVMKPNSSANAPVQGEKLQPVVHTGHGDGPQIALSKRNYRNVR